MRCSISLCLNTSASNHIYSWNSDYLGCFIWKYHQSDSSNTFFRHCPLLLSSSNALGRMTELPLSHSKGNSHLQWQSFQSCSLIKWSCQQSPCSFTKLGTNVIPQPLATHLSYRILLRPPGLLWHLCTFCQNIIVTLAWLFQVVEFIFWPQNVFVDVFVWMIHVRFSHGCKSHLIQVRRLCVCGNSSSVMNYTWWHGVCPPIWPKL